MHSGNLLLYKSENKILKTYNVCGRIIEFETQIIPKIFDWDKSICSTFGNNSYADYDLDENGDMCYYNSDAWSIACIFFGTKVLKNTSIEANNIGLIFSNYSLNFEHYFNNCKL